MTQQRHAKVRRIVPLFAPTRRRVPIGDAGVLVPEMFQAKIELSTDASVIVDVAIANGRARATAIVVEEAEGRGLSGLSINGITVARMLDEAVAVTSWVTKDPHRPYSRAGMTKATRQRVSAERLERVAEVLAGGGGADEVIAAENGAIDRRQAYRLMKRVREGGAQ